MKGRRDVNAQRRGRRPTATYWAFGVNAIQRRLAVRLASIREVCVLSGEQGRRGALAATARAAGLPVRVVDSEALRRLTGTDAHQGIAALVGPFPYAELSPVLESDPGPVLVLDHVQDPQNLGALVRTAAAAGMAAVVLPRHEAAGVSGAVEKVSAGAVHDVPVCQVANVHRTLLDLRGRGYWNIGLAPAGGASIFQIDLPPRVALVLGGETGLRALVEATCDLRASIPQREAVESLNASVAGAIAMYEVCRRQARLDTL